MGTYKIAAVLLLCAAPVISGPAANFKSTEAKAHYEKALEYGNQNLWTPARLELNRARVIEPANPEILIELGIAHGELKDWEDAIATLRKAVELAPGSVRAHYNLALTLDRADPSKGVGIPEYRKALKIDPADVDSLINLAVDRGEEDAPEARSLLARALKADPNNANAHLNLGLLLKKDSEFKGAAAELREAARLNPKLVEAHRQLIPMLASQAKWAEVVEQCRKMLEWYPDDFGARYTMGQALIREDKTEEGKAELAHALELRKRQQQQQQADKVREQGIVSLNKGNTPDALSQFKSAVSLDDSSVNHMYLGLALGASGDMEAGVNEISAAVRLDPKNAQAHLNLGSVYMQTNQELKARGEFEKAVELEPWFPEAQNNLGLVLAKNGALDEAIEHFRRASELSPGYVEAWFNLGLALRTANRLEDAVEAFRHAAKAAPDNAQVQYALGMTLKDKGDVAGSQAALNRAQALQQKEK
jgi:tetratricopeptide (TPR) repeat protein